MKPFLDLYLGYDNIELYKTVLLSLQKTFGDKVFECEFTPEITIKFSDTDEFAVFIDYKDIYFRDNEEMSELSILRYKTEDDEYSIDPSEWLDIEHVDETFANSNDAAASVVDYIQTRIK